MTTQPDAPGAVLTISQDPAVVTVIERFDVPKERQDEAVEAARAAIAQSWKAAPAFVGAALLRSRIHGGVSVFAHWSRPEDGAAPLAPPSGQSLAGALSAFPMTLSKTFSLEFHAHARSVAPPTLVSVERTPAGHFGLFTMSPERQNRMVDLARAFGPRSLGTPGLLGINFHRSLDGERVVNFGLWAFIETDFNKLSQRPGFRPEDLYWGGVAEAEPDFFDVVAVEAKA